MEMNATTVIARPIEEVFAYVSDATNDVNWRAGVTDSGFRSDQPLAVGTTGYVKVGDGEAEYRVISFTAGESVDWELLSGPYKGFGGYRFRSVGGGTEFTLVSDVEPTGLFKLLGPIFRWMGRRGNQADVEKLRQILESSTV